MQLALLRPRPGLAAAAVCVQRGRGGGSAARGRRGGGGAHATHGGSGSEGGRGRQWRRAARRVGPVGARPAPARARASLCGCGSGRGGRGRRATVMDAVHGLARVLPALDAQHAGDAVHVMEAADVLADDRVEARQSPLLSPRPAGN